MIFLYRIIVTIAALLIIGIGGSWLGQKFNVGPDTGLWEPLTFASYYQSDLDDDGIPATGSGDVSVRIMSWFRENSWAYRGDASHVLPVTYGRKGFFGFSAFGSGSYGSYQDGGSCSENTVNLLIINKTHPEGSPVFKQRVLLPRYFYFADGEQQSVAALVISRDTNEDGKLDCGDEAQFELRSLNDEQVRSADRIFIPDNVSRVTYDTRTDSFTFAEVEYQDGQISSMKTVSISQEDLEITEAIAPDLITKANEAFAITSKE